MLLGAQDAQRHTQERRAATKALFKPFCFYRCSRENRNFISFPFPLLVVVVVVSFLLSSLVVINDKDVCPDNNRSLLNLFITTILSFFVFNSTFNCRNTRLFFFICCSFPLASVSLRFETRGLLMSIKFVSNYR